MLNNIINAMLTLAETHTQESLFTLIFFIPIICSIYLFYFKIQELNPNDVYTNNNIIFLCILEIIFISSCIFFYKVLNYCIEHLAERTIDFWSNFILMITFGILTLNNTHRILDIIYYRIKH